MRAFFCRGGGEIKHRAAGSPQRGVKFYNKLNRVALGLDDVHDLLDVLFAGLVLGSLDHDADQRLGAGLTDQDAARVAQSLAYGLDGGLHIGVILRGLLVGDLDVLQHLRIDLQRCGQLAHRLLLGQHDLHHLQARQDAVAGAGVLGEDDVAALLAADAAAVFGHVLINILVTDGSLGVANTLLVERLVQTEVGHDGGDDGVHQQLAALLHVAAVNVQDVVAGDDVALFIHAEAAVGVAVVGKADVEVVLYNELLQTLNVGGAGVQVDVQAVGLVVDDVGVCTESIKNALGNVPAGTVGAVQADLDPLEGVNPQRDQVSHVAVASADVVDGAADMVTAGKRQLGPILVKDVQLAVEVILDEQQRFLVHLLAVAVDELDAVVIIGVVAGGDHDAAVKVVHAGNVCDAGRGGDMQQVGVRAGSRQACDEAVLKHVGAAAGIFADDDARRGGLAVALAQHTVIPTEEAANLVGMVGGQSDTGLPAEAVSTKVFSHCIHSFLSD